MSILKAYQDGNTFFIFEEGKPMRTEQSVLRVPDWDLEAAQLARKGAVERWESEGHQVLWPDPFKPWPNDTDNFDT